MPSAKMKRVSIYIYCSFFNQTKAEAAELVREISGMVRFVYRQPSWQLADVYMDYGHAAPDRKAEKDNAPSELDRLVGDILAGRMDLILIRSIDALGGTANDAERVRQAAEKGGVDFYLSDADRPVEPSDVQLIEEIQVRAAREMPQIHRYATKCLGYDVDPDGVYEINGAEVDQVRTIFALMRRLGSAAAVARELTARQIKTPRGRDAWSPRSVMIILRNPLYRGSEYLDKDGTLRMSPAIIDRETWTAAQPRTRSR